MVTLLPKSPVALILARQWRSFSSFIELNLYVVRAESKGIGQFPYPEAFRVVSGYQKKKNRCISSSLEPPSGSEELSK